MSNWIQKFFSWGCFQRIKLCIFHLLMTHIITAILSSIKKVLKFICLVVLISINKGIACPKDDLESLWYLIIYFIKGSLPWINSHFTNDTTKEIITTKQYWTNSELWYGLPIEVLFFLRYVRLLEENENPNYKRWRKLFTSKMNTSGFEYDWIYDWDNFNFNQIECSPHKSKKSDDSSDSFNPMAATE